MVRDFVDQPIDPSLLTTLLDLARRAPSAGHTAATEFVVLTGADRDRYWDITLPGDRRDHFTFPRLPNAGALVLILTDPEAYVDRYAEDDKQRTGLGTSTDAWPVPFWWVDSGAVVQNLLLLAAEEELGACLFGVFDNETAVKEACGIPPTKRIIAAIALGYPSEIDARPGRSAPRRRPPAESIIHWQRWTPGGEEPPRNQ